MSALELQFHAGGIWLPRLNLWLDASEPVLGAERVFVSHAHSDHTAQHREVIVSAPTARFMQARLGARRAEQILAFGETRRFDDASVPWRLTLLPAGHIFGSAMAFIEAQGESLLYTGDFKLRRGLSAEACEPRPAEILIMETTYGRPQYRFPPTEEVMHGVVRFCREALDNDETVVLLGYSLGKSQEILQCLAGASLPVMLHGTVHKLTQIYEQLGHTFPAYLRYEAASAKGKVLLGPPNVVNSAMLRHLGKTRVAVLTGWAVDPDCRYRYRADAAFPLSDHADFADLIELVKRVSPRKIYTVHGFAADFAGELRRLGFDATALSEHEQMELALAGASVGPAIRRALPRGSEGEHARSSAVEAASLHESAPPIMGGSFSSFALFAETAAAIAGTSSKLEKIRVLSDYLRVLPKECLNPAVTWFTGLPFASSENKVLQLGWALLRDALCAVSDLEATPFHQVYLRHGDLGEAAFEILQQRPRAAARLSLADVQAFFERTHGTRGPSGKLPLLVGVLANCSSIEAKFLVKIITGELRIGLKEGLVEEAVAAAFKVEAGTVRQTCLLLGNVGETAELAARGDLARATLVPFRPVKFMLATPEATAPAIWSRMQSETNTSEDRKPTKSAADTPSPPREDQERTCPISSDADRVLWLEDKYDGIRCQLHKVGSRVALFSRDLKDNTASFPELANSARQLPGDMILDGEILAMRGDEVLPFSELQRRLGRREGDFFMGEEIPIKFIAFDLLWRDGEMLLDRALRMRRAALESIVPLPETIRLAQVSRAESVKEIEAAFVAARGRHNEGLLVKDPGSAYSPGRRGLAWLKLKKAHATLDCVVVGAEYGHGKRNGVLSDYTFAVRDEQTGELRTIGKAYSGLTDEEIAQLTSHFLSRVVREHGRYHEVYPDVVLEIAFDRIQPSARHTSGLAMRFPRIVRIRTDKTVADIDTVASARQLM